MTCKDFFGMIPDFLDDRLENTRLREFLDHCGRCESCYEELEIQYLVSRAFDQIDTGGALNINTDLPAYIEKERRLLQKRTRLVKTAVGLECAAVVLAVITAAACML